jgi:hypothetical protein
MTLTRKQFAMLTSLYKRYKFTGKIQTFVTTKGISTSTMKAFLRTGYIETDREIKGVPSNMRITDVGIKLMDEYYETKRKSIDRIITRNKQYIRFVQDTEEKRIELLHDIEGYPIILFKDVSVVHRGYGIFEVIIGNEEPQYYGVYSKEEAVTIDIGGFKQIGQKPWYVEKVKLI